MGAVLNHADGRTDRHDTANSRYSQFCELAYCVAIESPVAVLPTMLLRTTQ
jgi:hypothetical protein